MDKLNFDDQTGSFTAGNPIEQYPSGATATILRVIDEGTTGYLVLDDISGTFQDDEIIYESALGGELWDAPAAVFTSGTYGWAALGTCTIANDTNRLKITCDGSHAFGARDYLQDAKDLTANLTVGAFYRIVADAQCGTGNTVGLLVMDGVDFRYFGQPIAESETEYIFYFLASNATGCYFAGANMVNGDELWLDNLSLKPVTNAALADGTVYEDISLVLYNFIAKPIAFNFNAKPIAFNFNAKTGT